MAPSRSFAGQQALASALALLVAAAGCGQDGTGLRDRVGPPGINIVSGANVTDTAGALLSQPLRVVIRNARGHAVPGAVVRFSSPPIVGFGGIPTVSVAVGSVPPRVNGSS